jgi:RNA polymerase subunit RPABC4/transcription elongation factor Spt4
MKTCPKCDSEVDDNFELCWNCQYSFTEEKVLDNSDYKLICPQCNIEINSSLSYCPYCQYDLRKINKEIGTKPQGQRHIDCLRCSVPLDFIGNFKFHEDSLIGPIGNLVNGFIYKESFDFYCCPTCGKVEFFLPG